MEWSLEPDATNLLSADTVRSVMSPCKRPNQKKLFESGLDSRKKGTKDGKGMFLSNDCVRTCMSEGMVRGALHTSCPTSEEHPRQ